MIAVWLLNETQSSGSSVVQVVVLNEQAIFDGQDPTAFLHVIPTVPQTVTHVLEFFFLCNFARRSVEIARNLSIVGEIASAPLLS
jgi:hypothetical protein